MSDVIPDITEAWFSTRCPTRNARGFTIILRLNIVEYQTGERAMLAAFIRFKAKKEIENKEKRSEPRHILQE